MNKFPTCVDSQLRGFIQKSENLDSFSCSLGTMKADERIILDVYFCRKHRGQPLPLCENVDVLNMNHVTLAVSGRKMNII